MYFQVCSNSAYPQHSGARYRTMVLWFTYCRNVPKFLDKQVWANSVDTDHCLPFHLYVLNTLLYGKANLFEF